MLILILFLIIGSALVYISKFNFTPVTLNLGMYVLPDIPLFYVMVGSLLTGLVLSYLVYLIQSVSTLYTLRGKNKEIKKSKEEILELTRRIHQLELEQQSIQPDDPNSL
jgi:uncharacterized integral membrane protein